MSTVFSCYQTLLADTSSAKNQLIWLGKDNYNTKRGPFLQKPPVKLTKTNLKPTALLPK